MMMIRNGCFVAVFFVHGIFAAQPGSSPWEDTQTKNSKKYHCVWRASSSGTGHEAVIADFVWDGDLGTPIVSRSFNGEIYKIDVWSSGIGGWEGRTLRLDHAVKDELGREIDYPLTQAMMGRSPHYFLGWSDPTYQLIFEFNCNQ